jgi:hypothetical protein
MMALAAAAALTTTPPAATNMAASSVSNSGAQASSPAPAVKASTAAEKVYCTSGTISGSRIVKRECKTKGEWAKDGVDVNDLMNSGQE